MKVQKDLAIDLEKYKILKKYGWMSESREPPPRHATGSQPLYQRFFLYGRESVSCSCVISALSPSTITSWTRWRWEQMSNAIKNTTVTQLFSEFRGWVRHRKIERSNVRTQILFFVMGRRRDLYPTYIISLGIEHRKYSRFLNSHRSPLVILPVSSTLIMQRKADKAAKAKWKARVEDASWLFFIQSYKTSSRSRCDLQTIVKTKDLYDNARTKFVLFYD